MTATARRRTQIEPDTDRGITCEVRSPESTDVLGYLVVGGSAACLERALSENGFRLVPVSRRRAKDRPTLAIA
ncbi:MAG: hypothetical protein ACE149_04405 [Armatimonadota bacterium]